MRSIFFASAVAAVALVAAPAQAYDGFTFFLAGNNWQVPSCKAPKVLRETRDARSGRIVWRCVDAPQRTADATPARR